MPVHFGKSVRLWRKCLPLPCLSSMRMSSRLCRKIRGSSECPPHVVIGFAVAAGLQDTPSRHPAARPPGFLPPPPAVACVAACRGAADAGPAASQLLRLPLPGAARRACATIRFPESALAARLDPLRFARSIRLAKSFARASSPARTIGEGNSPPPFPLPRAARRLARTAWLPDRLAAQLPDPLRLVKHMALVKSSCLRLPGELYTACGTTAANVDLRFAELPALASSRRGLQACADHAAFEIPSLPAPDPCGLRGGVGWPTRKSLPPGAFVGFVGLYGLRILPAACFLIPIRFARSIRFAKFSACASSWRTPYGLRNDCGERPRVGGTPRSFSSRRGSLPVARTRPVRRMGIPLFQEKQSC